MLAVKTSLFSPRSSNVLGVVPWFYSCAGLLQPTLTCLDSMNSNTARRGYEVFDFREVAPVACPCGSAQRALVEVPDAPLSVHVTHISSDARTHYHRTRTETYYVLECGPDAGLYLDGEWVPVHTGLCVMIRPGTRHRAVGCMKILNIVIPKFDGRDEWFD